MSLAEGNKASGNATSVNAKPAKAAKPVQKADNAAVAASEKKSGDCPPEKERKKDVPQPRMQYDDKSRVEKAKRRAVVKQTEARNRVELFRHLPQYEHGSQLPDLEAKFFHLDPVHPAVYKVSMILCYPFISSLLQFILVCCLIFILLFVWLLQRPPMFETTSGPPCFDH